MVAVRKPSHDIAGYIAIGFNPVVVSTQSKYQVVVNSGSTYMKYPVPGLISWSALKKLGNSSEHCHVHERVLRV